MKNKEVRGILALIVVTALSFGVIAGSRALSVDMAGDGAQGGSAAVAEELDVSGAETIEEAARLEDGAYAVTVRTAGYAGDIVMRVTFEDDAETIRQVEVLEQNETETLGSRITEPEFLDQFAGAKAPVYLPGMTVEAADASGESGASGAEAEESAAAEAGSGAAAELLSDLEGAVLADGTYEAKAAEASNGYTDQVTITVADGKITEVNWEAVAEDGSLKSVLSENGEYVMTEDGPTWAEQSKALADALIENQSLSFLNPNAEGKTDAVSGVSISVNGFIDLAAQCLIQAVQASGLEGTPAEPEASAVILEDGTYEAKAAEASNGYTDQVTITVADGKITEVNWEAVAEDGSLKSVLSENGEYVMTEDGPTWAEQSKALADALIENQSLSFLNPDAEGKTDAVSGVSISVNGFISLAQQCLDQAAGIESAADGAESEEAAGESADAAGEGTEAADGAASQNGTQVDGVSGATRSSTAAVNGINDAYNFLQTVK